MGEIEKAASLKGFLEPAIKVPSDKNFKATYTLNFREGLALGANDPEQLTVNLTKFGGTEAYVEAHAQNDQEEVAA